MHSYNDKLLYGEMTSVRWKCCTYQAILAVLSQTALSQTVLPLPPPAVSGFVTKADSLFDEGCIKEAVAEYEKMYRLNPGDGKMIYNYACALSRGGQIEGWPKRSQVGMEAAGAAFFVLQHSNAEAQQKYISMFEKRCRENEASCEQYALMFDRMRMNQDLPQRYGTHYNLDNRSTSERILYPLEDKAKVDEWRKEIGLEPFKDYLKKANIEYAPSSTSKK